MKSLPFKVVFAGLCMFALAYRGGYRALNPAQPQPALHGDMLLLVSMLTLSAALTASLLGMKAKSRTFTLWCDWAYVLVLVIGISALYVWG
jgi:hypothetical protein